MGNDEKGRRRDRRQTLSESVWRRSVRGRNLRSVRFRTCETAKCPVSHLRNVRNAKCPVSHFEICEMRSVRFRTCECTIQIVPTPEHFAHTFSHAPFASSHMRAHLNMHSDAACQYCTGTLYYGYVVGGGRCETMYANACAAPAIVRSFAKRIM